MDLDTPSTYLPVASGLHACARIHALAGLAHSAMALDIYTWLAQRMHRVARREPQFISWIAIKEQFGSGFGRTQDFKRKFLAALAQALAHYPAAKIEQDGRGLMLHNSSPPVKKCLVLVKKTG